MCTPCLECRLGDALRSWRAHDRPLVDPSLGWPRIIGPPHAKISPIDGRQARCPGRRFLVARTCWLDAGRSGLRALAVRRRAGARSCSQHRFIGEPARRCRHKTRAIGFKMLVVVLDGRARARRAESASMRRWGFANVQNAGQPMIRLGGRRGIHGRYNHVSSCPAAKRAGVCTHHCRGTQRR